MARDCGSVDRVRRRDQARDRRGSPWSAHGKGRTGHHRFAECRRVSAQWSAAARSDNVEFQTARVGTVAGTLGQRQEHALPRSRGVVAVRDRAYPPAGRRQNAVSAAAALHADRDLGFDDRGPSCTLLAFVDDATSRLMQLRFVASESAFDYFRTTRAYLEEHGKPVAFYSDKHGIFRLNRKEAAGGEGVTQFGRALLALNIDIICANSPQAKGRIERAFGTLQDRMVKELRRAGVSSIAAANAWLPG